MQWAFWAAHHLAVAVVLGMLPDPTSSLVMPLAGAAAVAFDATSIDERIYIAVLVEATERVKARIELDGSVASGRAGIPTRAARGHRVLCLVLCYVVRGPCDSARAMLCMLCYACYAACYAM